MSPQPDPAGARDLAVVLQDLSWLLPRTIGQEAEARLDRLPQSELEVMRLLVRRPRLSVGEVARELGLRESNASAVIRVLVTRGLIERRRDESDSRVARLVPTRRAVETRRRREVAWGRALRQRIDTLPTADVEALLRSVPSLRKLADALGSSSSDGRG